MYKSVKEVEFIRPRAFIIGFVSAILICALTPFNNVFRNATPLGGGYFPLAPFYFLFWLVLITALGRKLFKGKTILTGTELIFSWVIMVLVSGIAYTGFARTFFINLTAPFYFASTENQWSQILHPLLPKNLFPASPTAIEKLYNGIEGGREMGWFEIAGAIPWNAWVLPFLSWGFFMMACYFLIICLVNLINRQAVENERMNFPLLIVPKMIQKAMDKKGLSSFLGNKFLLMGISIPVFLHLLNGFNYYFPTVPSIDTLVLAGQYFPKVGFLTGFIKLKLYFYPAFIGFAFLTSKQVSFSFWFFFILGALFTGVLSIAGYSFPASELGTTFGPTLSRPEETQMVGAFIVFFLFLFWLARFHFKDIICLAFSKNNASLSEDALGDKIAFWGTFIGSFLVICWFIFHGLSFITAMVITIFFFMFIMVATRIVCQGGITYFTLTVAPLDAINTILGFKIFSNIGLLLAGITQKVLFVDLRESAAPSLLHAQKVMHRVGGKRFTLLFILFTMLICLGVSALAMILLCYKYGIRELQLDWATRTTLSVYNNLLPVLDQTLDHRMNQGLSIKYFAALGAIIMAVLVVCYHRFYWWPLHPIGYLMVYSSAMKILWISFFIGWVFNALCMRYGGVLMFKKMRYFFVGLIMGDFLMGGTWAVVGMFTQSGYQVLPT